MATTPLSGVSEWTTSLHEIDIEPTSPLLVDAKSSGLNVGLQDIVFVETYFILTGSFSRWCTFFFTSQRPAEYLNWMRSRLWSWACFEVFSCSFWSVVYEVQLHPILVMT
jgi:hypothetical protein